VGLLERAERVQKRGSQAHDVQARGRLHAKELQQRGQSGASDPAPEHHDSLGPRQVTTLLDRIYETVKEKKQMSLREVADTFHVPLAQAEQWGRMLDQQGMLELSSTLKTPVLRVRAVRNPASRLSRLPQRLLLLIAGASLLGLLAVIMFIRFL